MKVSLMSIVRAFGVSTWVGFREEELYTGKNKAWRSKPKCVCVGGGLCVCVYMLGERRKYIFMG